MSHIEARLQPRPTAGPFTAAMIGTRTEVMPRTISPASAITSARSFASRRHAVEQIEVAAARERLARAGEHDRGHAGIGRELGPDLREPAGAAPDSRR